MHESHIVCGDNIEVLSTFSEDCIDLVVTSPPYDDARQYGKHKWDFNGIRKEITRVLKLGGVCVWIVSDTSKDHCESLSSFRQAISFVDGGLNLLDTMIYRKRGMEFPRFGHRVYPQVYEFMFVFSKGSPKTFNLIKDKPNRYAGKKLLCTIRNPDGSMKNSHSHGTMAAEMGSRGNVWEYDTGWGHSSEERFSHEHPAIFPEALAKDHILSWSNPGDTVLDPFCGSGTTCKAAKELNRKWIGIEVNPDYCKIAEARLLQDVLPLS
jgi:site-specific DNA-methyltransferase (adenine-specific)